MKESRILLGNMGLLLIIGLLSFPSPAHATMMPMYSPISFTNYSVTDTVTTNVGTTNTNTTQSQTLAEPGPQSITVSSSNGSAYSISNASITASVNPQEILNTSSIQSISPSISINQTTTESQFNGSPPFHLGSANAISSFTADFKGTGNLATFYVTYSPNESSDPNSYQIDLDDRVNQSLSLVVTNNGNNNIPKTQVAFFNAGPFSEAGPYGTTVSTNFTSPPFGPYGSFNPPGCCLPGPFFLYFATQLGDTYTVSGSIDTSLSGAHAAATLTAISNFQLVANTPEPSTVILFGSGILLVVATMFRNRKGLLTRVRCGSIFDYELY